jgi:hypothetical protein
MKNGQFLPVCLLIISVKTFSYVRDSFRLLDVIFSNVIVGYHYLKTLLTCQGKAET